MLKDFYLYAIHKVKQNYQNPTYIIINFLVLNLWIYLHGVLLGTLGYLITEVAILMFYYYLYITDIFKF